MAARRLERVFAMKITVAYALPDVQFDEPVELPADSTVADALAAVAELEPFAVLDLAALPVGVFNQLVSDRSQVLMEGDRVEIYRPLEIDPMTARQQQRPPSRRVNRGGSVLSNRERWVQGAFSQSVRYYPAPYWLLRSAWMSVSRQTLGSIVRHATLGTLVLALLGGCGWPRVHKVIVQQGNVISQEMIDKLKPGMTRSQVAYIMGEPVVRNTFNDSRWDYVYTLENPGVYEVNSSMSLFFSNDRLTHFVGDLAPSSVTAAAEEEAAEEEVVEGAAFEETAEG